MLRLRSKQLLRMAHAACASRYEVTVLERSYALFVTQHVLLRDTAGSSALGGPLHQQQEQQLLLSAFAPSAWTAHSSNSCRHFSSSIINSDSTDGSGQVGSAAAATARPRDMAIVFTCAKCDTRSVKAFTRQAYERGLVLITCPGCQAKHLIADHLGWFGDSGFKIDAFMASQGQQVKRVSINTQPDEQGSTAGQQQQHAQVTAEDIAGWSKIQQLISTVAAAAGPGSSSSSSSSVSDSYSTGCSGHNSHHQQHEDQSQRSSISTDTSPSHSHSSGSVSGDANSRLRAEMAAAAATTAADTGVFDVSPEDVESWVRVQQEQQH